MLKKRKTKIIIISLVLLFAAVLIVRGCGARKKAGNRINFLQLKNNLPLYSQTAGNLPAETKLYLRFYGLGFDNISHEIFRFQSGQHSLAGQFFLPPDSEDLVICIHGYMNHVPQLKNLVKYLNSKDYAVGCFDLPGHGLSGGVRGAIDDFEQYSKALSDFINLSKKRFNGKIHLIGFSTGGSAVIDALLSQTKLPVDKIILAAPLVHNASWDLSRLGCDLGGWLADTVPNMYLKNCENPRYSDFVKNDPLIVKEIPVIWLEALFRWNEKIDSCQPYGEYVKIIQGDKDGTVDWEYNLEFLREKFPRCRVTVIEGADHELFNERMDLRTKVLDEIIEYLED